MTSVFARSKCRRLAKGAKRRGQSQLETKSVLALNAFSGLIYERPNSKPFYTLTVITWVFGKPALTTYTATQNSQEKMFMLLEDGYIRNLAQNEFAHRN